MPKEFVVKAEFCFEAETAEEAYREFHKLIGNPAQSNLLSWCTPGMEIYSPETGENNPLSESEFDKIVENQLDFI